jgi:hypothetical protein
MTSHTASDIIASIEVGAILVALLIRVIWREFCSRPYVRDKERADLIAKHPLLQMPKRGMR